MNQPMSPPPPPAGPPAGSPPSDRAASQVQGPAIGLIVTAVVGVILGLMSLMTNLMGTGLAGLEELTGEYEGLGRALGASTGALGVVSAFIGLAISGFIIWAALQMKDLRNWTLAMVASILAMIPCIGPCCLIGLPVGIWSLVVLMNPEVKAAFKP